MTYAWDNNHNKTSETITGTMANYGFSILTGGYDNEERLVSFIRTSGLTQSWNLSAVGDWNSVTTKGSMIVACHACGHLGGLTVVRAACGKERVFVPSKELREF
jgi:hypothetical protein